VNEFLTLHARWADRKCAIVSGICFCVKRCHAKGKCACFSLMDGTKEVARASSAADGKVCFPAFTLMSTGVYRYEIRLSGGVFKGRACYSPNITVTVTDGGEDGLLASVAFDGGRRPCFWIHPNCCCDEA